VAFGGSNDRRPGSPIRRFVSRPSDVPVMTARTQRPAATRTGTSVGAVLVLLQFAVVAVMLVMGQVDWERTMATAPQPVGSAEASQGPADFTADLAADLAGEAARVGTGAAVPVAAPAAVQPAALVAVPVERVVTVGTAAAEAASTALPRRATAEPLAVVAAEAASAAPLRAVRLETPADASPVTTEERLIAVDPSGIPLPPPAD
jgi:hypothetical protein